MYFLKLGLLFFWAAWFSIVTLTNVTSALKALGMLGPSWRLASRNYPMVVKAVSLYDAPAWVPKLLFMGVIAWQAIAAALFWLALASSAGAGVINMDAANMACAAGIFLWAAFMIADEVTIKYAMEQPHELLLIAQLGSLLVMHLL
jgi:hypothetical protein